MRFLHVLIILIVLFFAHEFVFAQNTTDRRPTNNPMNPQVNTSGSTGTTSRSAAMKDNLVQAAGGLAGIAAGAYLAEATCTNPSTQMMCQVGIMMGVQSVSTVLMAPKNTKPTSDALSTGGYGASVCDADPSLCNSQTNNDNQFPDPTLDPIIDQFRGIARSQGVDIDNPQSVEKFMNDHADLLSSGAAGNLQMPAGVAQKIDQYKKHLESKYKVSSVDLESGGGGRMPSSVGKSSSDLDFNSLLEGLNPKEKHDANVEGLSRTLASGEPVGIASDNIFKQVSRRYQAKRQSNSFLK